MRPRRVSLAALAAGLLLAGCASSAMSRYDWSLYDQIKDATPEAVKHHTRVLERIVAQAKAHHRAPRPGACAELGYSLAVNGEAEKGTKLLDDEVVHYPESAKFVAVLKRLLKGEEKIFGAGKAQQEEK